MAKLKKVKPEIIAVEAFHGGEGKGNLAGVCILQDPLSDAEMQSMAKKFGASETAFVVRGSFPLSLRWFTPTQEVSLCGHGTLATAFTLWQKGLVEKIQEISFQTLSGLLTCRPIGDKIEMSFPELSVEPSHVAPSTLTALGISKPLYVGISEKYILVEVESEKVLRTLDPDFAALRKASQRGFLITTRSERAPYDFISRCFYPKEGITEDPVTGSAHCVFGPYWKRKLSKDSLLAFQASNAGGEIEVAFLPKKVLLRGKARFRDS